MRQIYLYCCLLIGIFLYSCKCEVKYDYKNVLPTAVISDFLPYHKDSSFMMKFSNGTIVHYTCTDRTVNTANKVGGDTHCKEKKANCHFSNTVPCDGYQYFDIKSELKCEEEDSLSLFFILGSIDDLEMTFKNNPSSYIRIPEWGFEVEDKCNSYYCTCLSSFTVNTKMYHDVIAVPNKYATPIDSLYYNGEYGILKIKFKDGNSMERIE